MRHAFEGTYSITNPFGVVDEVAYARYPGKRHPGTDYNLPVNTKLYAGMSGTISRSMSQGWYGKGNELIISNGNVRRQYGHMNRIDVADGQWVNEGDYVGLSGNTGYVLPKPTSTNPDSGAHLHDELIVDGQYVSLEENLNKGGDLMTPQDVKLAFLAVEHKEPTAEEVKLFTGASFQYYMDQAVNGGLWKTQNHAIKFYPEVEAKLAEATKVKEVPSTKDTEDATKFRQLKDLLK